MMHQDPGKSHKTHKFSCKIYNTKEKINAMEMHKPYTYLQILYMKDLKDLIKDIKSWNVVRTWIIGMIIVIIEYELHEFNKLEQTEYEAGKYFFCFFLFVVIIISFLIFLFYFLFYFLTFLLLTISQSIFL